MSDKNLKNKISFTDKFVRDIFLQKISTVVDEFDEEIYEISKQEVDDILIRIDDFVDSVFFDGESLPPASVIESAAAFKRSLHTLKGSARMAGANRLGMIAHRIESLLDFLETRKLDLRDAKHIILPEIEKIKFLNSLAGGEIDEKRLSWLDGSDNAGAEGDTAVISQEDSIGIGTDTGVDAPPSAVVVAPVTMVTKPESQYIRLDVKVLDSLLTEASEMRLTRTILAGSLENGSKSINDLRVSTQKLSKMLKEVEIQSETQILAKQSSPLSKDVEFDPLEFDRFTRLQELTRFMNEAIADVVDAVESIRYVSKTQEDALAQQFISANSILESVMKVRLVAVETISDRFYKIARSTSKEVAKQVQLEMLGESTEVDRVVLDRIQSPIEHLLRNCIAHGIEPPEDRILAGKSPVGQIKIEFKQEANLIFIIINDDGSGINLKKIREIGVKRGLIQEGGNYSDEFLIDLIFRSGFSTADSVSQVSGRGVGMDVVKSEIFSLGGSIKTKTSVGKGTVFTITLPSSVATNHSVLVNVKKTLVAIPAMFVDRISSFKREALQEAYTSGVLAVDGENVKLFYLTNMMGVSRENGELSLKAFNTVIIVSHMGQRIAFHVDGVETTEEILVKPIGQFLAKTGGILGATLLGDGRQGVVINPILLKDSYLDLKQNFSDDINNGKKESQIIKSDEPISVLVVDDSVTVRRATSKVLEKHGYTVILAKDGADALDKVQTSIPDIILSDVEMPVMDGFEFVKNLKSLEMFKAIPIIMITSRTADKHKNHAFELGVDGFLGKPYQEEELMLDIKRLLPEKFTI